MSHRLFYVVAAIAVIFTVAGVLVLQNRSNSGSDSASVSGPDDPVLDAKVRRLSFYDWERNVIGPQGRPAPGDPSVTGGPNAGQAGSLSLYDAVLRAATRPALVESDNGRTTSVFYAVDRRRRRILANGAPTREQALAAVPAAGRAAATVYEVKPDTAIVGAADSSSRWFVIKDDVAIHGSQIRNPRHAKDQISGRPVIFFFFSDAGRALFRQLTQALAARGSQSSLNQAQDDPALHNQHFAVVYENKIVTTPFVDFRQSPDGLDPSAGTQLSARLP
jgi:SecD/SecF fusion protein